MVCEGGAPFDLYNRIMEVICPTDSKIVVNIMNDIKNKATNHLKSVRTISNLNGLFGLRVRIWDNTYIGASELIFWMNGSSELHNIVEFPVNVDRLLYRGRLHAQFL